MATNSRPLGGSASALWDYLTGEEPGGPEYYMGSGLSHGEVWGAGAARLGVTEITRAQFAHLANGKSLNGRETLIQSQNGKHVPLIDVTFSAPPSVKELLITASAEEREAVEEDFRAAVKVGFLDMEAHAPVARVPVKTPAVAVAGGRSTKTQGSATERVPAELIGFVAVHHTARPTPETVERGSPPDPHLHVHVAVFNMGWAGDKWRSVDDWGIKHHASKGEREAIVMGEFARRLEARGYRLEYHTDRKGRTTWELAGSNPAARRFFSTNARRAAEMARSFERDTGRPPTQDELRTRMRESRLPKDKAQEHEPDFDKWRKAAARAGVKVPRFEREATRRQASVEVREAELRARLYEPEGLCREDATFARESIRPAVSRCAVGLGFTPEELDDFSERLTEELVRVRMGPESSRFDYFTTPRNVEQELYIGATAETKAAARSPTPSPAAVQRAIEAQPIDLDDEQRAAVELACSERGWVNIEGHAGTGKTTALKAVVAAFRDTEATGSPTADQVIVVCTAAATARRTGTKLDADGKYSVEAFASAVSRGEITVTDRTVIIVDEAVMVDTPREAKLLEVAGPARIINVGDIRQLQAIGAAGWYEDQASRLGRQTLTQVHRQKDHRDVEALDHVRNGRADKAMASFIERDRLHVDANRAERIGRVVADYKDRRNGGRSAEEMRVVIETTNHEVDTVNRLLQDDRLERGELRGAGIEITATDEARTWKLYEGDSIIFLTPYWHRGQDKIANGTTGRIVAIANDRSAVKVEVETGERYEVRLEAEDHTQPIGLNYAVHTAKFQGGEVAVVQAVPGLQTTSLESGYSQLTRGVEEIHLYLDRQTHGQQPIKALADAWATTAPKRSATARLAEHEAAPMPSPPSPARPPEAVAENPRFTRVSEVSPAEVVELEPVRLEPAPELEPLDVEDAPDAELVSEGLDLDEPLLQLAEERSIDDVLAEREQAWEARLEREEVLDLERDVGLER